MKKFLLIIMLLILFTGCGKEEVLKENPNINEDNKTNDVVSIPSDDNTDKKENTDNKVNNDTNKKEDAESNVTVFYPEEKTEENKTTEVSYSNKDVKVINTLQNTEEEVDTILKEGKSESIKDKAKGIFITLVDFAFYDGEINGVTFKELTDAGKTKVLQIIKAIDEKIENYFPGYKETISSKTKEFYNKASEMIKKGANNLKDFAKEKLGEEYYQDIIEAKDELVYYTKNALSIVGSTGSSVFNSVKDKLNNWYQNFKNSN